MRRALDASGPVAAAKHRVCALRRSKGRAREGSIPSRVPRNEAMSTRLHSQTRVAPLPSVTSVRAGLLQRKCACGGSAGLSAECEECGKQQLTLQSRAASEAERTEVPPIVHDVLHSPGDPLDPTTRTFMESRFGHDFGRVRVHTDARAAESAREVDALAYTVGRDVVFAAGQFAPGTASGKRLLAHELTHVAQQGGASSIDTVKGVASAGDASEWAADSAAEAVVRGATPMVLSRRSSPTLLLRKVGSVNCPPNSFGAPADPKAALEAVDPIAVDLANRAADSLAADVEEVKGGIPDSPSVTFRSYQDHFGLPNALGNGFLNRLTGVVRSSLEIAASEELRILSRRFRFAARLFSGTVNYRCPGTATVTLPGCGASSCGAAFAFSCRGGGTIALCQPFWDQLGSDEAKAAALIHESMHMIFGRTGLSQPGEIGEETQKGPGRNFNVAGCYEFIIDDIAGVDSFPVCPPVP